MHETTLASTARRIRGVARMRKLGGRVTARVCVAALLAACSTAVVHATPPAPGFAAAAARLMTDYTDRNQFSGYVLVAHEGSPVFAQGFGFADREAHRAPAAHA